MDRILSLIIGLFNNPLYRIFHELIFYGVAVKSIFLKEKVIYGIDNDVFEKLLPFLFALYLLRIFAVNNNKVENLTKKHQKTLELCFKSTHNFNHKVRNEFYTLRSKYYSNELQESSLTERLESSTSYCIEELSKILVELTGEEVCIHIKTFVLAKGKRQTSKLQTLCNCNISSAYKQRFKLKEYEVNSNFIYETLLKSKKRHLYISNFPEYIKKLTILDTNLNLQMPINIVSKFYNSIALVPIQLEKQDTFDVVGILIADCQVVNGFPDSKEKLITDIMKTFSDNLYTLIDRVYYLQNLLKN